jgi:hypothetical protein
MRIRVEEPDFKDLFEQEIRQSVVEDPALPEPGGIL